jgi:hypothetical protein
MRGVSKLWRLPVKYDALAEPLNLSPIVSLFGLCSAQKVALLGKLTDQLQPPFLLVGDPLSRKRLSLPAA